jgi:uncharacterized repeat protein (TIGR03803 family)
MLRLDHREPKRLFAGILALAAGVCLSTGLATQSAAADYQLKVLQTFCQEGCREGSQPSSGLIMDAAGNLYGETSTGGRVARCHGQGCGSVFELRPDSNRASGWAETVLYRFCPGGLPCADGYFPSGGLLMDATGNLFGVTQYGGAHKLGVVFELTPNASRTAWTESVLYSFCAQTSCADAIPPSSGLIMDTTGNLYGTATYGGAHGQGVVFELTPNASRTAWTESVLYSFCAQGDNAGDCFDGAEPVGGLLLAGGSLYGTTARGGPLIDAGGVFELTPNADHTAWTERALYFFCAQTNCADGGATDSGLIMDAAGNIYGTTPIGGNTSTDRSGFGTVFELTPNADRTAWSLKVLYRFCARKNCADGGRPYSGLIMDQMGNLFGTTGGGFSFPGTIFELTPNAAGTGWTETVLQRLYLGQNSGMTMDTAGNLYGTRNLNDPARRNSGFAFELVKSP